jgi:hypothetical protein
VDFNIRDLPSQLMLILWAALGVSHAFAVCHQVAAVVGLVWIMFIESFLGGPAPHVARFLPVHA